MEPRTRQAFIISSVRTPVGKARKGVFANQRPEYLGSVAVRGAIDAVDGLEFDAIDDVLIGCAFPEGPQGMNLGRIIAQKAGLPDRVPGATINRFCSSGLQSIVSGVHSVMFGQTDVVVAGGVESMSLVPMSGFYFSPDPDLVDDDPAVYVDMGNTAENVADVYEVTRKDQDRFSLESHRRALEAIDKGRFRDELIPVHVEEIRFEDDAPQDVSFDVAVDEGPRRDTSMEALASLPPVFRENGSVSAGNSSQMSDGAAAAVIMAEDRVHELGIEPMARLLSYAVAGVDPEVMGIAPIEAIPAALEKAQLTLDHVGLIELNEAFASQAVAVIRELGLDPEIVNVNGGAIALGHPLGCTGAKLTATLLHEMRRREVRYGVCSMCIGGGMGAAAVFENMTIENAQA